jgi:hypothetical protein
MACATMFCERNVERGRILINQEISFDQKVMLINHSWLNELQCRIYYQSSLLTASAAMQKMGESMQLQKVRP